MKDDRIRLVHIIDALERVERHLESGDRDEKSASAILYELTIIGEASKHITIQRNLNYRQYHGLISSACATESYMNTLVSITQSYGLP